MTEQFNVPGHMWGGPHGAPMHGGLWGVGARRRHLKRAGVGAHAAAPGVDCERRMSIQNTQLTSQHRGTLRCCWRAGATHLSSVSRPQPHQERALLLVRHAQIVGV
jgi:hypothetical protein